MADIEQTKNVEQNIVNGIDQFGNPVVDDKKVAPGYGAQVLKSSSNKEFRSYDPNLPKAQVDIGQMVNDGAFTDVYNAHEALEFYNSDPVFDEEKFRQTNKDKYNDEQLEDAVGFIKDFITSHNDIKQKGGYFSNQITSNNTRRIPLDGFQKDLNTKAREYATSTELAEFKNYQVRDGKLEKFKGNTWQNVLTDVVDWYTLFADPTLHSVITNPERLEAINNNGWVQYNVKRGNEIKNYENIRSVWGPQKLESSIVGSIARAIPGTIFGWGYYTLGMANLVKYQINGGVDDNDLAKKKEKYLGLGMDEREANHMATLELEEKDPYVMAAKNNFATAQFWKSENADEYGSVLDNDWDWNRFTYGITDSAVQLLPTMFISGITAGAFGSLKQLGRNILYKKIMKTGGEKLIKYSSRGAFLEAIPEISTALENVLGQKIGNKAIDRIVKGSITNSLALNASLLYGSATVSGMESQALMEAGFTADEAFKPAIIMGTITYLSERVLNWNIAERFGADIINSRLGTTVARNYGKDLKLVMGDLFEKYGVKSVKELDKNAKKRFMRDFMVSAFEARGKGIINNKILSKSASFGGRFFKGGLFGGIEEGAEEYIEGIGHAGYAKIWLNDLMRANAHGLQSFDKGINTEPIMKNGVWTGEYKVTDKNGNETIVDGETIQRYKESISIADEVISGSHDFAETASLDESFMAFIGTFVSMGVMHGGNFIKDNEENNQTSAELAMEFVQDPKQFEKWKVQAAEYKKTSPETLIPFMDAYEKDIEIRMDIIKKYGINSRVTKLLNNYDNTLLSDLVEIYRKRDLFAKIQSEIGQENFEWTDIYKALVLPEYRNEEGLKSIIEIQNNKIKEYTEPKPDMVNASGKTIQSRHSKAYSRKHMEYNMLDKAIDTYIDAVAAFEARTKDTESKDENGKSEYDNAVEQIKKREKANIDKLLSIDAGAKVAVAEMQSYLMIGLEAFYDDAYTGRENETFQLNNNRLQDYIAKKGSTLMQRFHERFNQMMEDPQFKYGEHITEYTQSQFIYRNEKGEQQTENILPGVESSLDVIENSLMEKKGGKLVHKNSDTESRVNTEINNIIISLNEEAKKVGGIASESIDNNIKQKALELKKRAQSISEQALAASTSPSMPMSFDKSFDELFQGKVLTEVEHTAEDIAKKRKEALWDTLAAMSWKGDNVPLEKYVKNILTTINSGHPLSEDLASHTITKLQMTSGVISQMKSFLKLQDEFQKMENGKDAEHSPTLNNPDSRLNTDEIEYLNDKLAALESDINKVMYKASRAVGDPDVRAIKEKIYKIKIAYSGISANADKNYYNPSLKKKIKAIFKNIFEPIELEIKDQLEEPGDNLTENLFAKFKSFPSTTEGRIERFKFSQKYIFPLEKALIDIQAEMSGSVSGVLEKYDEIFKSAFPNLASIYDIEAFNSGKLMDHEASDAGIGTLDPEEINASYKALINGEVEPNQGPNSISGTALYMMYNLHKRANSFGQNGSISIKDAYHAVQALNEKKIGKNKSLLEKYNDLKEGTVEQKEAARKLGMYFDSNYSQIDSLIHIIGFLADNSSPRGIEKGLKKFNNLINVRGYSGAGKTTQVVIEALDIWYSNRDENQGKKILYIGPNHHVGNSFREESKLTSIDQEDIEIITTSEMMGKDLSEYDLVVFDEMHQLSDEQLWKTNKIGEKIKEYKGKVIAITDEDQSSPRSSSSINMITKNAEKTIPITEVYRVGLPILIDLVNNIREGRYNEKPVQLTPLSYYEYEDGQLEGGRYFKTTNDVIDYFKNRVKERKPQSDQDMILVLTDMAHLTELRDSGVITDELMPFVKIAGVTLDPKLNISGISSTEVYVAVDVSKNSKYYNTGEGVQRNVNVHAKAKDLLTAASRTKQFVALVTDGTKNSPLTNQKADKPLPRMSRFTKDGQYQKFNARIEFLSAYFDAIVGPLESEEDSDVSDKPNVNEDKKTPDPGNQKTKEQSHASPIVTEQNDPSRSTLIFKKEDIIAANKIAEEIFNANKKKGETDKLKRISEAFPNTEADHSNKVQNSYRYHGMVFSIFTRMTDAQKAVNGEFQDKKSKAISRYEKIFEDAIEARLLDNGQITEKTSQKEKDALINSVKNQFRYSNIPLEISSIIGNTEGPSFILSPLLDNGEYSTAPLGFEIVGYQDNKPIVNLHHIKFSDTELSKEELTRIGARISIMGANGILVNQVKYHSMIQKGDIKVGKGKSKIVEFKDANTRTYSNSNLLKYELAANKVMGVDELTQGEVLLENLYSVEREIGNHAGINSGDIVNFNNNREVVEAITARFNGSSWEYTAYIKGQPIVATDKGFVGITSYDPSSNNMFRKNVLNFINGGPESTRTSYIPFFEGMPITKDDIYDRKNKNIVNRRTVLNEFTKGKLGALRAVYHKNFDVLKRDGTGSEKIKHTLTYELQPHAINLLIENVFTDYTVEQFKNEKLHIIAVANPVDFEFKEKVNNQKIGKTVNISYSGVVDNIINKANSNNYPNGFSFETFLKDFADDLKKIPWSFKNQKTNKSDDLAPALVKYNKYKLYRLALASNSKLNMLINLSSDKPIDSRLELGDPVDLSHIKEDAIKKQVTLETEIKYIGKEVGKDVYGLKYSDDFGNEGYVEVRGKKITRENSGEFIGDLRSDIEIIRKDIRDTFQLTEYANEKEKFAAITEFRRKLYDSLSFQFIMENKAKFISNDNVKKGYTTLLDLKPIKRNNETKYILVTTGSELRAADKLEAIFDKIEKMVINSKANENNNKNDFYMPPMKSDRYAMTFADYFTLPSINLNFKVNEDENPSNNFNALREVSIQESLESNLVDSVEDTIEELYHLLGEATTKDRVGFSVDLNNPTIQTLITDGELKFSDELTDESCLAHGGAFGFTPGGKWDLLKEFKGKSHANGGIDISISNGKISLSRGSSVLKAANGLVVAANGLVLSDDPPINQLKEVEVKANKFKFVDSPDDPEYKAYQDSLVLYNFNDKLKTQAEKYWFDMNEGQRKSYLEFNRLDNTLLGKDGLDATLNNPYKNNKPTYSFMKGYPKVRDLNERISIHAWGNLSKEEYEKGEADGYYFEFPVHKDIAPYSGSREHTQWIMHQYKKPEIEVLLRSSDKANNIELQKQMKKDGYYDGEIDGIIGEKSKKALLEYNNDVPIQNKRDIRYQKYLKDKALYEKSYNEMLRTSKGGEKVLKRFDEMGNEEKGHYLSYIKEYQSYAENIYTKDEINKAIGVYSGNRHDGLPLLAFDKPEEIKINTPKKINPKDIDLKSENNELIDVESYKIVSGKYQSPKSDRKRIAPIKDGIGQKYVLLKTKDGNEIPVTMDQFKKIKKSWENK